LIQDARYPVPERRSKLVILQTSVEAAHSATVPEADHGWAIALLLKQSYCDLSF
jgi:hypothetical protein